MEFSRQEYWSGLPCPPPGDLPHSGIKPASPVAPALQVDSLLLSHWKRWCITGYQLSADSKQRTISMWSFSSVQFGHSVLSDSLRPHGLQHARPPCPSPTPGVYSNPCLLSWWCHSTISSSVVPSPPALNLSQHQGLFKWVSSLNQVAKVLEFQLQQLVLLMNIQDWFPLGWTGWISLQSKGLSRVFSNTTVQKHQFFCTQLFDSPTLTSIHDSWKNHSLD